MIADLPLYPLGIDWTQPATLGLNALNGDPLEAIGGSQQRLNLRAALQRRLRFSEWVNGDARRTWDRFVDENPPGTVIGVPLWTSDGIELTAAVAPGATVLPVSETAHVDWRSELVLWQPGRVEAAALDHVDGLNLHLTDGITNGFGAGAKVLPLLRGRVPNEYAETEIHEEASEWELEVVETLDAVSDSSLQYTAPTYRGTPIFPLAADLAEASSRAASQRRQPLAGGTNRETWAALKTHPRQTRRLFVSGRSRQALARLQAFFHDRRGGWHRFWLLPLKHELTLASAIGPADTTIHLANFADYAARFQLGAQRRVIAIERGDRVWIRQALNLAGGDNRVSLDAPLGAPAPVGETKIGLVMLGRFATDDIEIEFAAPVYGTATLTIEECEREYAEALGGGGGFDGQFDAEGVLT